MVWDWSTYLADYGQPTSKYLRVNPATALALLEKWVPLICTHCRWCMKHLFTSLFPFETFSPHRSIKTSLWCFDFISTPVFLKAQIENANGSVFTRTFWCSGADAYCKHNWTRFGDEFQCCSWINPEHIMIVITYEEWQKQHLSLQVLYVIWLYLFVVSH